MSDFLDRYGRSQSVCHRLPARLKLLLALVTVHMYLVIRLGISSIPKEGD